MRRRKLRKNALALADTLLGTAVDATLFVLYLGLAASSVHTMRDALRTSEEIEDLRSRFNYKTIKQAVYILTRTQLIRRSPKRSTLDITISNLGKKRLSSIIPTYLSSRPWDGYVYLVSYDIPTKHNRARDLLRTHIKLTGGAKLQESLWIHPYNPTLLLEEFTKQQTIPGTILVSKLGKDGTIGEEKLTDVVSRMYQLNTLSERYREFLAAYEDNSSQKRVALLYDYFTILRDDPQLPFELLPKNFPGDKAFLLAKPYLDQLPRTG